MGRRVLNVRICSCPKRDREKEEEKKSNKKVSLSPGKRRNNKRKSLNIHQNGISDKRVIPFKVSFGICF